MLNNRLDPSGRKGIKRGSYCKQDDKLTLFRIIEKYKKAVISKRIDSYTNKRKNEAWQRITAEFNAVSIVPKNEEQLKNIYRNKVAEIKRSILKREYDRLSTEYKPFLEFIENSDRTNGIDEECADNDGGEEQQQQYPVQIKQEDNSTSNNNDNGSRSSSDDDDNDDGDEGDYDNKRNENDNEDDNDDEDDENNERDDVDILLTELREGHTPIKEFNHHHQQNQHNKFHNNNHHDNSASSQNSTIREGNGGIEENVPFRRNSFGRIGGFFDNQNLYPNIRNFQFLNQHQEYSNNRINNNGMPSLFNGDYKNGNNNMMNNNHTNNNSNTQNNVQMKMTVNWRNHKSSQNKQKNINNSNKNDSFSNSNTSSNNNYTNPKIEEIKIKIMEEHLEQERLKRKILEEKFKIQELKRKKIENCFQNYYKRNSSISNNSNMNGNK